LHQSCFDDDLLLAESARVEEIAINLQISQKAVATYRVILKLKLGISNAVELPQLAMRQGVVLE